MLPWLAFQYVRESSPEKQMYWSTTRSAPEYAGINRERAKRLKHGLAENELPVPIKAGHCDLCGKPTRLCNSLFVFMTLPWNAQS
jgi:hypothetical protein